MHTFMIRLCRYVIELIAIGTFNNKCGWKAVSPCLQKHWFTMNLYKVIWSSSYRAFSSKDSIKRIVDYSYRPPNFAGETPYYSHLKCCLYERMKYNYWMLVHMWGHLDCSLYEIMKWNNWMLVHSWFRLSFDL